MYCLGALNSLFPALFVISQLELAHVFPRAGCRMLTKGTGGTQWNHSGGKTILSWVLSPLLSSLAFFYYLALRAQKFRMIPAVSSKPLSPTRSYLSSFGLHIALTMTGWFSVAPARPWPSTVVGSFHRPAFAPKLCRLVHWYYCLSYHRQVVCFCGRHPLFKHFWTSVWPGLRRGNCVTSPSPWFLYGPLSISLEIVAALLYLILQDPLYLSFILFQ